MMESAIIVSGCLVGGGFMLGLLGFMAYKGKINLQGVFHVLLILWKWLTSRNTLSMAIFSLEIAKSIFADSKGLGSTRNKNLLNRIEITQGTIDRVLRVLPNDLADDYVRKINNSEDPKGYGPFDAHKEPDRYGKGNDGVRLSIGTNILGVDVEGDWYAADGSAGFKLTI